MKSLQNRLFEGFYQNASGMVRPATKKELISEIQIRLDRGQTNVNDIDTSKITDMSHLFDLFRKYDLSKLDISKWDVSKVDNMVYMFADCTNFNCDLSDWNTKSLILNSEIFFNSGIKEKPKWDSIKSLVD